MNDIERVQAIRQEINRLKGEIDGHIVPGFCSVCEALAYANAIEAQALTPQPPSANNADGDS